MQVALKLRAGMALLGVLVGCGSSTIDMTDSNEQRIQQMLNSEHLQQVNAIEFLEAGGQYCVEFGNQVKYDKEYVLPLLKTLQTEFDLDWIAVTEREAEHPVAYDILAKVPATVSHNTIKNKIAELQPDLPVDILQSWGDTYLSLDFMPPEVSQHFAESKK